MKKTDYIDSAACTVSIISIHAIFRKSILVFQSDFTGLKNIFCWKKIIKETKIAVKEDKMQI